MPTYEYKCKACGHAFEQFQSMTAKPVRTCPACGKKAVERQIGIGAAVMFKGSGFYQTDYRSESYKKAAEADKKGSSTGEAPSGGASAGASTSPSPTPAPAPKAEGPSSRKTKKPAKE